MPASLPSNPSPPIIHAAILECIRITQGEVAYASERIAELQASELVGEPRRTMVRKAGDETVQEVRLDPPALHVWIQVRQRAMDRLVAFSSAALAAGVGVQERRARTCELALKRELGRLPKDLGKGALAASLMVMARGLDDPDSSFAARTRAQARLQDGLERLAALAPPKETRDDITRITDELEQRRRAARGAAAADSQSS